MSEPEEVSDDYSAEEGEGNENDVAIVGMSLRVPGAQTPDAFWNNLRDGVESIEQRSEEELLEAGESPDALRNPDYVPASGVLEDMKMFDGDFFGFSPKECGILDPQHRHFTECSWEALEDAGHTPEKFEGPIGVFGGCGMGSYFYFNVCSNRELVDSVGMFLLRHTGNDKDFLTTRVSYTLDLRGPAVNVQTACSTSLVATHLACQSLLSGESDMALAGGATILLPHGRGYVYQDGEILSPDGHCHAFDDRAQGTVLTSGIGVVALRRLQDAIDDNDHIYAVIKGSAINNDGAQKVGYLAPSVDGQAGAMAEAHAVSGVDARSIEYVECHGTGTYMGDPIEIEALTQAFRETTEDIGFCRVASVKTNIGHLDTAAGVASLIKASLSLKNEAIPPSIGYERPNSVIDFESTPFVVNDKLHPWPRRSDPRRAAVNSLGVGGTNAHVVLEEAPLAVETAASSRSLQLLKLSAKSGKSLEGNTGRLAEYLRTHPDVELADVAYTLDVGRREMGKRRVLAVRNREEAIEFLESNDPSRIFTHTATDDDASVVFMFSGAASQYTGMARGLYETEPVFREHLDRGIELLSRKMDLDIRALVLPESEGEAEAERQMASLKVQLPVIYIVECALAELWMSWDVKPAMVIGHSMGENTAAVIAGVLSFEQGAELLMKRGELFDRISEGTMTSIMLPPSQLEPLLGECDLAGINGPELCVASGSISDIEGLEKRLSEQEIDFRRIDITRGAHSYLLDPILDEFRECLHGLDLKAPTIPVISNLTGKILTDEQATSPDYWVDHLRGTVRFADGVDTALEVPGRILLEVGPGQTLCAFARQHPKSRQGANIVPSLRRSEDSIGDDAFFLASLGRLWASGLAVDLERLREGELRKRVPLPTYAWNHQSYFIEAAEPVAATEDPSRVERIDSIDDWGNRPVWLPTPLEPSAETGSKTWLVFMDEAGVGQRLKKRLTAQGHAVVSVVEGDAYLKRAEDEFVVAPELGASGYAAVLRELVASGRAPDHVVHLWQLTATERFRPGSSFFHQNLQNGFYSLYFLAKAIGEEDFAHPLQIDVVSNGMQRIGDADELAYPEKATLLGPVQVIPREFADVRCRSIDVALPEKQGLSLRALIPAFGAEATREDRPANLDEVAEQLAREVIARDATEVIAHRGKQRFVRRYEQHVLPAAPTREEGVNAALREGGTYLITGGLGGLGLNLASRLATDLRAKLVLVGRSGMPPREEWDEWLRTRGGNDATGRRITRVRELEAAGAEVEIASADVTNLEQMREVVSGALARFGSIHGFFHTAGVVRDELIQLKVDSDIEDVFGPKVYGTVVLDSLLEEAGAELFVLFSSTSAITAPAGQIDYAGANAFLDAYAQSKSVSSVRTVAVNWGIWNQVGMAAESFGDVGGESDAGPRGATGPVAHPLIDQRATDSHGRTVFEKQYVTHNEWVLDEHRTKDGQALLPGTGYPELAQAALAAYGEQGPFEIRDLYFIRPLYVADGGDHDVRIALRKFERGYRFEVRTACQVDGRDAWALNAQSTIEFGNRETPAEIDLAEVDARCQRKRLADNPDGHRSGQELHVAFGPRWRVMRDVVYGEAEALATMVLPDAFESDLEDYALHPAMLDYATGYAMELIENYVAEDALWVPVSYGRMAIHGRLPKKFKSWVRNAGQNEASREFAVFDVTITDPEGNVLIEIEDYTIHRLVGAPDFAGTDRPRATDVEFEAVMGSNDGRDLSPAEEQLRRNYERGIRAEEGNEALMRVLAAPHWPQVAISSLDLMAMKRQAETALDEGPKDSTKFGRPDLDSEYVEPRDEIERTLVGYWEELLGVEGLGVQDGFFDLGGHSLVAVRLFTMIKKTFKVDFPISVLFDAPTIEGCAELIREAIGDEGGAGDGEGATESAQSQRRTRHRYLVSMDARSGDRGTEPPFYLVAGMFGNVLNLRHLAALVGTDRPFYGLQARGLYGDEPPHQTFPEAAAAYIEEIKTIQPDGPYYLGGFSGGGLTAIEMAHQLRAAGDEVALLVLLDSPLPMRPTMSKLDKVKVQWQRLRHRGPSYLVEWGRNRAKWQMEQLNKKLGRVEALPETEEQFNNVAIEEAFRAALPLYEMRHYAGRASLFRPKLDRAYQVGPDRYISSEKEFVFEDNGFGPWFDEVDVYEMPGNHDSMVLEPNVRVMAAQLRTLIEDADRD